MHGASGLEDDVYPTVVASGISKINFYTAMARDVTHGLREVLMDADEFQLVYHQVIAATIELYRERTRVLLEILHRSS
jgi:fructose/tagatose bisphosphate aldolase